MTFINMLIIILRDYAFKGYEFEFLLKSTDKSTLDIFYVYLIYCKL
jgi:hypothetical protein